MLDWDGNIAQTLNMWPEAMGIVLRQRGFDFTKKECIQICGGTVAYLTSHGYMSTAESEEVLRDATEIVKERLPQLELYPDALDVLRDLKESGKKLALITSSFHRVLDPVLTKFELDEIFDVVLCSEDVENIKPHPEPLHKALKQLGGTPAEAIMIGDSDKDILAGHNAGLDSVLFFPVEHQEIYNLEEFMGHAPTYVVSNFWDVSKIVKGSYSA